MHSATAQTGVESKTAQSSLDWREVRPDELGAVWPHIEPFIERACQHGQGDATTTEHVRAALLLGKQRMWVVLDGDRPLGGIIWSARQKDTGVLIWVDFIFGAQMDVWLGELMELGVKVKEATGAYAIEGSCRPGLARILSKNGWRQKAVIMEM